MPPAGIALVVGFFVILAVCLYWDKSTSKRFQKKISQEYQAQESFGDFFVTANGELLCYLPSGTLAGYKKWNLSDIACICTDGDSGTGKGSQFCPDGFQSEADAGRVPYSVQKASAGKGRCQLCGGLKKYRAVRGFYPKVRSAHSTYGLR